jgi:signal transduction histidine kinase
MRTHRIDSAPRLALGPGPDFPLHSQRVRARQRATLLAAGVLFAVYYIVFTSAGLYNTRSLASGLTMAAGLLFAGLVAARSAPPRLLAIAVGATLAIGATVSAHFSGGSHCVGFDTLWAIPLIYGLFFQDQPLGTTVAWGLSFMGGVGVMYLDGETAGRIGQWMVLSISAGVFTLAIQRLSRREVSLLLELNELALSRLALADRLTATSILGAGVAHEVNNPLTLIVANVDFAAHQLRSGQWEVRSVTAALNEALVGCDRVTDVVKSLADLSRPAANASGAVDLNAFLHRLIRLSRVDLERHATLTFSPGSVPVVSGDEPRLAQVVLNLLTNAAQAVAARPEGPQRISVRTQTRAPDQAIIEVEDTGTGMTAEQLPRIFEPFFTTKPQGSGTGLGLALAARIIDDHHGLIEVESTLGVGSTFRIVLPGAGSKPHEAEA